MATIYIKNAGSAKAAFHIFSPGPSYAFFGSLQDAINARRANISPSQSDAYGLLESKILALEKLNGSRAAKYSFAKSAIAGLKWNLWELSKLEPSELETDSRIKTELSDYTGRFGAWSIDKINSMEEKSQMPSFFRPAKRLLYSVAADSLAFANNAANLFLKKKVLK